MYDAVLKKKTKKNTNTMASSGAQRHKGVPASGAKRNKKEITKAKTEWLKIKNEIQNGNKRIMKSCLRRGANRMAKNKK